MKDLEKQFGKNKIIPSQYKQPILIALSCYPQLKNVHIHFMPVQSGKVAYGTTPGVGSVFKTPLQRKYTIRILEQANPPLEKALLKNCPFDAQIGVMGHELAHVAQFNSCSRLELLKMLAAYTQKKSRTIIERGADLITIEHGLGANLYAHAVYIRKIPGYIAQHPNLNEEYLKPNEILERIERKTFEEKI